MTSILEPQTIMPLGDDSNLSILWFQKSNTYAIVSNRLVNYLHAFLSETQTNFFKYLKAEGESVEASNEYFETLGNWLHEVNDKDINRNINLEFVEHPVYNQDEHSTTHYFLYNKWIAITFPNQRIKKLIHPQWSYYEVAFKGNISYDRYDIVAFDENLILYFNETFLYACNISEVHIFLGKFSLQIISLLFEKQENQWLATFHASTVANHIEAFMCIGKSGSGKSTLCSLLSQYGYDVLADDLTPMQSSSLEVFRNPSAISIKRGAFNRLKPYFKDFERLTTGSNHKGDIRFLPVNAKPGHKVSFKCRKVILVNYDECSEKACLEVISKKEGLHVLITESWVSGKAEHALQFLNWVNMVTFYKLTYSRTEDAVKYFSML